MQGSLFVAKTGFAKSQRPDDPMIARIFLLLDLQAGSAFEIGLSRAFYITRERSQPTQPL
jgi:hypothetical protein